MQKPLHYFLLITNAMKIINEVLFIVDSNFLSSIGLLTGMNGRISSTHLCNANLQ